MNLSFQLERSREIMKEKNMPKSNWMLPMAMLVISFVLCASTSFGGNTMEPLYNINEAASLKREEYDVTGRNLSLLPVPQDNAVGTNDMGNAITLLSFRQGRVRSDRYFRNATHDFEGGGIYLPVISKDIIGFAQVRRFLLFNFETKDCRDYRIVMSLEKTIDKVAIADVKQKHFIFDIQAHNPRSEDPWDFTKSLQLVDLSGTEPKLIKELPKEIGVIWSVVSDRLFLQARRKKQLQVLNMSLEPASHPLAEVLRENKDRLDFCKIHSHPYLPFAILTGGAKEDVLISWQQERDPRPLILFGDNAIASHFSFSPDGKWVVFKSEILSDDTFKTYLMPVSEKYPNYLGSPILLANDYFDSGHFAWTTNPISFVGSSLSKLYRWELTNEAHPESDKPTFHDYIVENDLRKLTWEKRQGLGEKPE
jgi:hypothetical protein